MSAIHGQFIWCELMTTDAEAATAFYAAVMGWNAAASGLTDRRYTRLSAGDVPVAGLMDLPAVAREHGARPAWLGYIGVDDVDSIVARISNAGGGVHRAAETIANVGRFAVVHDPQGAAFVVFTPSSADQPVPASFTPGHVGWRELHAANAEAAFVFYADLFGWTKADTIDMGPMGPYQLFATRDLAVGGMMTKMEAMPVPFWTYYFNVEAIDAAMTRVTGAGGQILNGPHQVPGGSWIAQGLDPQGALVALVAPGR